MKKREIPFKNYIILLITILGTILLCLYLMQWYKKAEENSIEPGVLAKELPQVTVEEFQNYVMENPNTILYISKSTDESIKKFEKTIYNFIVEKNIRHHFIYIDASKVDMNAFSKILKEKSNVNKENYTDTPNIYVFKEGKIEEALYKTKDTLEGKEAVRFLKKQDVVQ